MYARYLSIATALLLLILLGIGHLHGQASAQFQAAIGIQREPHLVVDSDNNLYLVMAAGTHAAGSKMAGSQIFFTESTDGGSTWDNPPQTRILSNSRSSELGALFPRIAVTRTGPPRAYVVYDDDTSGARQAYFVRSKKNTNFKRPALLSPGGDGAFTPVVALDSNGAVNTAWADSAGGARQVLFSRSSDSGVNFSQAVNVATSAGEAFDPAIAVDDKNAVSVVWEDTRLGEGAIFFSRSTDGGLSFSAPKQISAALGEASDPELAVDRFGGINAAWIEEVPAGGTRVMISRTSDGGQSFSAPLVVTAGRGAEFEYLAMTTGGDRTYLMFNDETAQQVYLAQGPSSTMRFAAPLQLSHADTDRGRAHSPSVAVDGNGRVHAVWIDTSILGNDEGLLVYRSSADGQSFTTPVLILAVVG